MYRDIVETRLIASLHVFDRPFRPLSLHRACRDAYLRLHQMPMHGGRPRVRCGETRIRLSTLGAAVYVDCRACCNSYCARFALSLFHEDRMRLGKARAEASSHPWLCTHLSLSFHKIGCISAIRASSIALDLHYLCRAGRACAGCGTGQYGLMYSEIRIWTTSGFTSRLMAAR